VNAQLRQDVDAVLRERTTEHPAPPQMPTRELVARLVAELERVEWERNAAIYQTIEAEQIARAALDTLTELRQKIAGFQKERTTV